jgi:ribonuclease BN (tRNA processing enzyme)
MPRRKPSKMTPRTGAIGHVCFLLLAALGACVLTSNPTAAATLPAAHVRGGDAGKELSTRIILLGTMGGPVVDSSRSEPAALLVVGGIPYLIDAGASVSQQVERAGFKLVDVRHIFITHHHIDHSAGLVSLMSFVWFQRAWNAISLPPVEIYGPPATQFLVGTALSYLSVSERIFRAGAPALALAAPMFQAHDIDHDGVVYRDANITVTAAENTHYTFSSGSPATGRDKSYSYRFDTPQGAVVFTGDTGPSEAVTRLARGAAVLVSEVCLCLRPPGDGVVPPLGDRRPRMPPKGLRAEEDFHSRHEHLTPEEVGVMAARANAKVVLLTHLAPGNLPTDLAQFTAGVQKHFGGTVIAGRDLLEYDIR